MKRTAFVRKLKKRAERYNPKPVKPSPRKAYLEADRLTRVACVKRANHTCEWCGVHGGVLQCHHVLTRRIQATRHMRENVLCLCVGCHGRWHAAPRAALAWFIGKYGEARYAAILAARNAAKKVAR